MQSTAEPHETKEQGIITFNEGELEGHLKNVVRSTENRR